MDPKKMTPSPGEDESVLDQAEDALVGDHEDGQHPGAEDKHDHEDTRDRPFLKSP
ncbi:MAG TPA: hypothetical protein VGJ14_03060 [Sporichthyaceae bacterium]|jgi:hypothetical protein